MTLTSLNGKFPVHKIMVNDYNRESFEQKRPKNLHIFPVPWMKGVHRNNGGPIAARFAELSSEMCYQDDIKHERKDVAGAEGGGPKESRRKM